jgi:hypothetical protein
MSTLVVTPDMADSCSICRISLEVTIFMIIIPGAFDLKCNNIRDWGQDSAPVRLLPADPHISHLIKLPRVFIRFSFSSPPDYNGQRGETPAILTI